ncbi:MAG: branched-chain amino acid ABC transporter permease [Anaerolineae bacterium]
MLKESISLAQPALSPERRLAIIAAFFLVSAFTVPLWADSGLMRTLIEFIYLLALAQMWNLLAGYAGMVSIGQQAWIGLGGYAMIVLADDLGLNVFVAVFLAGLVAMLFALPTAVLVFRLRAGYFAIGTWVIAEVFRLLVASSTGWLQGESGRTLAAFADMGRNTREIWTYLIALVIGFGSIALVYYLMRSKLGLGLTATRDSEAAAGSVGIDTYRLKLMVFLLSAFGTGVVGALIYLTVLNIRPSAAFSVQWTAFMIFIVVIGGIGTMEGPIIGAIIFFVIREYLSNFGEWSFIFLGVIAIVIMLFMPQGVWGLLHRRFGLELFPVRRRLPPRLQ